MKFGVVGTDINSSHALHNKTHLVLTFNIGLAILNYRQSTSSTRKSFE
jgi:hypothetical protein